MSIIVNRRSRVQIIEESRQIEEGYDTTSVAIAFYLCTWVIIVLMLASPQFQHWFVLPVWACGIVIGIDAVNWARRRIATFDPVGIVGLLGFYFFFLAPLLHVHLDYWMRYVTPPTDWQYWLGWMAVLNFSGLLIYRFVVTKNWQPVKIQRVWKIDEKVFSTLLFLGLLFTFLLQVWVYTQFGGILGYIRAYEARLQTDFFAGMGWLFMLSESFPILMATYYAYHARKTGRLQSWQAILLFLLLFFILRLFFGGMRGSRSNTIWALFWAVGIIHIWVRPISHRVIMFLGLPLLLILMYMGGLYKAVGLEIVYYVDSISTVNQLAEDTGRDIEATLLGDFSRSDVQALLLSRILEGSTEYQLSMGRTYYGALSLLVPRFFWPERPPSKVKEGTEILYGRGFYDQGFRSSRVYGLAGETMLNFGPWLVPLAFAVFGLVVSAVRGIMQQLEPSDSRLLLLPLLINLCFVILVSDSDNILFFIIKNGFLPFALIFAASSKILRRNTAGG